MKNAPIKLSLSSTKPLTAYVYMPKHPKKVKFGIVDKTVGLRDLIENFQGPDLFFDFDKDGELIGIEILGD